MANLQESSDVLTGHSPSNRVQRRSASVQKRPSIFRPGIHDTAPPWERSGQRSAATYSATVFMSSGMAFA